MRTLRNAVEQGKVHHAYLFVGSRGTGKTSMAKMLAACMNCEQRADGGAVRAVRVVHRDRQRDVAGRHRDGRGVEQLGRRHPRAARVRAVRAGVRAFEGLHPRRGAHAVLAGLERVPQDARGAAAAHDLRPRHHRGPEGPADGGRPLPPLRLRPPDGRADRRPSSRASPPRSRSRSLPTPSPCSPATRPARSATRSARSSSSSPTRAPTSPPTTSSPSSASPTSICSSRPSTPSPSGDARAAWLAAARLADTGRDIAQFLKDLEAHARDLLVVQTLGEVPARAAPDPRPRRAPRRAGRRASPDRASCACSTSWPRPCARSRTEPTPARAWRRRWSRPPRRRSTPRPAR